MARTDYDLLSTAPPEEPCVEGDDDPQEAQEEGKRYIELIRKVCGVEPAGSTLKVKCNPHDFGTYYTVVFFFDDERDDHIKYMRNIENDGPLKWDDSLAD